MESRKNIKSLNRYLLFTIFIFLFVNVIPLQALDKESEIDRVKNYFYHFDFPSAYNLLDSLQQVQPDEPVWIFYEAYLQMIVFTQDMTNEVLLEKMKQNFKKSIRLIKNKPDYKNSAELNYYMGLSNGAIGIYYVVDRNYVQGFLYGRRAKNDLEKTVRLNPDFHDAYLGLGIYHYYVGIMPGILRFLARIVGFSGNTEQGLSEIKKASEQGRHFKIEAILTRSLVDYFFRNRQHEPVHNLDKLARQFPGNPAFQLILGYHYRRTLRPERALTYFEQVDDKFFSLFPQIYYIKYYNMMVCHYRLNKLKLMEEDLHILHENNSRMTMYYKSALHYYQAMLAIMNGRFHQALIELKKIPDKSHTKYWYLSAQIFLKNELKDYLPAILRYENLILSGKLNARETLDIEKRISVSTQEEQSIWVLYYLDWKGVRFYFNGNNNAAIKNFKYILTFENVYDGADYFLAWVHLHLARALIELHLYEEAEMHLKKASDKGDDYMKLILERERNKIKGGKH